MTTSVEDILFVQTGDDSPLKVALMGEDLNLLQTTAEKLKTKVEKIPGLIQIKLTGITENGDSIEHFKGKRAVYLSANLAPNYTLGEITTEVESLAQSLLPTGVSLELQGDSARIGLVKFLLSLRSPSCFLWGECCLFPVLLFRSFLEPLVIALSLPLSIVGAMLGLLITQSDFGMISLIGLIFLLGLLDKNAILLIDYANQLRKKGFNLGL